MHESGFLDHSDRIDKEPEPPGADQNSRLDTDLRPFLVVSNRDPTGTPGQQQPRGLTRLPTQHLHPFPVGRQRNMSLRARAQDNRPRAPRFREQQHLAATVNREIPAEFEDRGRGRGNGPTKNNGQGRTEDDHVTVLKNRKILDLPAVLGDLPPRDRHDAVARINAIANPLYPGVATADGRENWQICHVTGRVADEDRLTRVDKPVPLLLDPEDEGQPTGERAPTGQLIR